MSNNLRGFVHVLLFFIVGFVVLVFFAPIPKYSSGGEVYCLSLDCPKAGLSLEPSLAQRFFKWPGSKHPDKTTTPEEPSLIPNNQDTSKWKAYIHVDEEILYSVKHPSSTTPHEVADNGRFDSQVNFKSADGDSFFTVVSKKNGLMEQIEYEKWILSHSLLSLVDETNLLVDGLQARRLDYETTEEYEYDPTTLIVVSKGEYAYTISAHPKNIDQILSTFIFMDTCSFENRSCPEGFRCILEDGLTGSGGICSNELLPTEKLCVENGGTWYQEYGECEGVSRKDCEGILLGDYNDCASNLGCRHPESNTDCLPIAVCIHLCSV
ncbi:hypothetical protein ACFL2C_01515 [Patescibacteria group bacterium]